MEEILVSQPLHEMNLAKAYDSVICGKVLPAIEAAKYDFSCAWITFATGDNYIQGARVLGRSLLKSKSRFKLIIIVPLPHLRSVQQYLDENVIFVGKDTDAPSIDFTSTPAFSFERYKHCINKIYIWTFLEYEKVCWLDSDLVILQNIDELFDIHFPAASIPVIAGARGCTCNSLKNPKLFTRPEACPFLHFDKAYINAGLFVTSPSISVYNELRAMRYDYPFAEQDVYNQYFMENGVVIQLDTKYNYLNHIPVAHPEVPIRHGQSHLATYDAISVFHFCYGKPWESNILNMNNDIYDYWISLSKEL